MGPPHGVGGAIPGASRAGCMLRERLGSRPGGSGAWSRLPDSDPDADFRWDSDTFSRMTSTETTFGHIHRVVKTPGKSPTRMTRIEEVRSTKRS